MPRPGSSESVPWNRAPVHLPLLEVAISGQDTDSSRRFRCRQCDTPALICRRCDRGQAYCSEDCSALARVAQRRAAEQRYRLSGKGRRNNAARQRRHRERQRSGVTHQGSASELEAEDHCIPEAAMVATLDPMPLLETLDDSPSSGAPQSEPRCCECGTPCSPFVRKDFLPPPTRRFKRRNGR